MLFRGSPSPGGWNHTAIAGLLLPQSVELHRPSTDVGCIGVAGGGGQSRDASVPVNGRWDCPGRVVLVFSSGRFPRALPLLGACLGGLSSCAWLRGRRRGGIGNERVRVRVRVRDSHSIG